MMEFPFPLTFHFLDTLASPKIPCSWGVYEDIITENPAKDLANSPGSTHEYQQLQDHSCRLRYLQQVLISCHGYQAVVLSTLKWELSCLKEKIPTTLEGTNPVRKALVHSLGLDPWSPKPCRFLTLLYQGSDFHMNFNGGGSNIETTAELWVGSPNHRPPRMYWNMHNINEVPHAHFTHC